MSVTRLTPEHAADYRALMLQAYTLHPDAFTTSAAERIDYPLSWWESRLAVGDGVTQLVFGAWDGITLVGSAGLAFESREKERHKATLFGMYVDASYRNRGLGRRLVCSVMDYGRSRAGTLLVQLTVTEGNVQAENLYTSLGFVRYGLEPWAVRVGNAFATKVHMWSLL